MQAGMFCVKLSIATNSLIAGQASRLRQVTEAQVSLLPKPEDYPDALFGVYYKALEEAGGFGLLNPISVSILIMTRVISFTLKKISHRKFNIAVTQS